jgi:hypothetical protein
VRDLPMLYFINIDKRTKVILETDACDYGIGSYLYQLIDGNPTPQPVAFISKPSLRKIRRKAQESILKFRIHLLTTMTRDRAVSRSTTSTKRDAKTKIANLKMIKASSCANIVETAIIGSAKPI